MDLYLASWNEFCVALYARLDLYNPQEHEVSKKIMVSDNGLDALRWQVAFGGWQLFGQQYFDSAAWCSPEEAHRMTDNLRDAAHILWS
jgi:hypothetical protein